MKCRVPNLSKKETIQEIDYVEQEVLYQDHHRVSFQYCNLPFLQRSVEAQLKSVATDQSHFWKIDKKCAKRFLYYRASSIPFVLLLGLSCYWKQPFWCVSGLGITLWCRHLWWSARKEKQQIECCQLFYEIETWKQQHGIPSENAINTLDNYSLTELQKRKAMICK